MPSISGSYPIIPNTTSTAESPSASEQRDLRRIPKSAFLLAQASLAAALSKQTTTMLGMSGQLRVGPGLDGAFSLKTGLLPAHEVPRQMPAHYEVLDDACAALPVWLARGTERNEINALEIPDLTNLPEAHLGRAAQLLSSLAHAFYYHHRNADGKPDDVPLPAKLLAAWGSICKRLGRDKTARVMADDILNNYYVKSGRIALHTPFFGLVEEELSAGLQGKVESSFAPALEVLVNAQKYVLAQDDAALAACLGRLSKIILACAAELNEMAPRAGLNGFDPVVWGRTYPEVGRPIFPDTLGNSGVDAPMFHALDSFFGRDRQTAGELEAQQVARQAMMPKPFREFFAALRDPACSVRARVAASRSTQLKDSFRACTESYRHMLERHRMKAVGSIGVVLASGRRSTAGGAKRDAADAGRPAVPVDERIDHSIRVAIHDRFGTQSRTFAATVAHSSAAGEHAQAVTLSLPVPLPLESGDHVHIVPRQTKRAVATALRHIRDHYGSLTSIESNAIAQQLECADLSAFTDLLRRRSADEPLSALLAQLPQVASRSYSVGPIVPNSDGLATQITLTVAHTGEGGPRDGLAVSYLRSLGVGDKIDLQMAPELQFHAPKDPTVPMVLLAQGSGVGPIVGFLRERAQAVRTKNDATSGNIELFVAARRLVDVPFLDELQILTEALPLTVHLALSQEQEITLTQGREERGERRAPHVQDLVFHHGQRIFDALEHGGHVFVCGSVSFGENVRPLLAQYWASAAPEPDVKAPHPTVPAATVDWRRYHEDLFSCKGVVAVRGKISRTELARHNRFDDLWCAFGGTVYNLTDYAQLHPGGSKVLMEAAGKQGDRRFKQIHAGPGSQQVLGRMAPYAVGQLETEDDASETRSAMLDLLDQIVSAQDTFRNNVSFGADRDLPYFIASRQPTNFIENGLVLIANALTACDSSAGVFESTRLAARDAVEGFESAANEFIRNGGDMKVALGGHRTLVDAIDSMLESVKNETIGVLEGDHEQVLRILLLLDEAARKLAATARLLATKLQPQPMVLSA